MWRVGRAVIDIGTNTLLLLIVDAQLRPIADVCRFGRLGQGLDATGRLADDAIARSLEILREYRGLIDEHRAALTVVATQAVREAVQPALDKSAEELVTMQRQLAPVDEGDLRESLHVEPGEHELTRKVRTDDFKARWQEFGTANSPAQPFFFVSYRLLRKRLQSRIKRAIGKAVRDEWARKQ